MNRRIRVNKDIARHLDPFRQDRDRMFEQTIVPGREPVPVMAQPSASAPDRITDTLTIASRTDIGRIRKSNQDALILSGCLVGVADGMGGHNGGEIASAGVRDSLVQQLVGRSPARDLLHTAVKQANRQVWLQAQEDPSLSGMGTTLDAVWFSDDQVLIAHVGDSRVYRLQNDRLEQITEDHSMVMEMFRAGLITREQAEHHPMKNVITRAMGSEHGVQVDMITVGRRKDDIWLICTDGLHGMVSDDDIRDLLIRYDPEMAAEQLLQAALAGGGRDNVSFVVVHDKGGAQ